MTETTVLKKRTGLKKKEAPKEKNKAAAFMNWELPLKSGRVYKGGKGFPIFQNPEYPNPQEDFLVELAKGQGGMCELTLRVRIVINTPNEAPDMKEIVFG